MTTKNLNIRVNQKGAKQAQTEMRGLGNSVKGTLSSLTSMKTLLTGAFATAIAKGTFDLIQMAGKAEGVERAFNRLGRVGLLDNLRKATRETVSNFDLMKAAVRAENFQIPLENLGTLLKFAQIRAEETGESVEYLTESIVMGIGRKSVMILDNLGISATRVRDEFKKTGDFASAVAKIVSEELGKSGEVALTTAGQMAQLSASWENLKLKTGEWLVESLNVEEGLRNLNNLFKENESILQMRATVMETLTSKHATSNKEVKVFIQTLSDGKTTYNDWLEKQKNDIADKKLLVKWQSAYAESIQKTYGIQMPETKQTVSIEYKNIPEYDKIFFDQKAYDKAIEARKKIKEKDMEIAEDIERRNSMMADSLASDMIGAWKSSFDSGSFEADKFFQNLADRIIENLIYSAVSAIIEAVINYYTGGSGGSWLGSALDWVSGKQSGGPVSKDKPVIVGEAGAELFIPSQSGHIVPNNQINNYAGNSTIENKFYFQGISDKKFIRDMVIPEIERVTRLHTV